MGAKPLRHQDYIGKKFNRLFITGLAENINAKKNIVHCVCECGNEIDAAISKVKSGNVKSCGCQKIDSARIAGYNKLVDLIGKRFGKLTVLSRYIGTDPTRTMWLCRCDCGNETTAESYSLKTGKKKSCGCYSIETTSKARLRDIAGERFGLWRVIERDGSDTNKKNAYWLCKCDCGNIRRISGNSLRMGLSMSCGCEKSHGERLMADALRSNGIYFESQKKFSDCICKNKLSFDFYIPRLKIAIEIQGIQHYEPVDYFGGAKKFLLATKRDNIKREYCKNNGIHLIEIRCDELQLIPAIIADIEINMKVVI